MREQFRQPKMEVARKIILTKRADEPPNLSPVPHQTRQVFSDLTSSIQPNIELYNAGPDSAAEYKEVNSSYGLTVKVRNRPSETSSTTSGREERLGSIGLNDIRESLPTNQIRGKFSETILTRPYLSHLDPSYDSIAHNSSQTSKQKLYPINEYQAQPSNSPGYRYQSTTSITPSQNISTNPPSSSRPYESSYKAVTQRYQNILPSPSSYNPTETPSNLYHNYRPQETSLTYPSPNYSKSTQENYQRQNYAAPQVPRIEPMVQRETSVLKNKPKGTDRFNIISYHPDKAKMTLERYLQGKDVKEIVIEGVGTYIGELIDGEMNGYGEIRDEKGEKIYTGWFVDSQFEGAGILFNSQADPAPSVNDFKTFDLEKLKDLWLRYEGQFKESKFEGIGHLFFPYSCSFLGEFAQGEATGFGVVYLPNKKVTGKWKNNRLVEKI